MDAPPRDAALRIVTWNIHGAIGADRRRDPRRIVAVLDELDADVVALQEVDSRRTGYDVCGLVAREARYAWAAEGPTMRSAGGHYGNALLSRFPLARPRCVDLSVGRHEPRSAIDALVDTPLGAIRFVATHLGLSPTERRTQVRCLLRLLGDGRREQPVVLLGDLNEWFLWGRPLRWLHRHFGATRGPATFPARLPLAALDRIWLGPPALPRTIRVHRSPLARVASDHLPLVADVRLSGC